MLPGAAAGVLGWRRGLRNAACSSKVLSPGYPGSGICLRIISWVCAINMRVPAGVRVWLTSV